MPNVPLCQAIKVVVPEHHGWCIISLKATQQATAVVVITLQQAVRSYHDRQLSRISITVQPFTPFRVVHLDNLPGLVTVVAPFAAQWVGIGEQLPVAVIRVSMCGSIRQGHLGHQPPVIALVYRAATQRVSLRHQLVVDPLKPGLAPVRRAFEQDIVAFVAHIAEYPAKPAVVVARQGIVVIFKVTRPVAFRGSVPDCAAFFIVIVLNPGRT